MPGIDITQKKKIGFISSGGGVKAAAFHTGVAMALEQTGFIFSSKRVPSSKTMNPDFANAKVRVFAGSSAGALVTTFLAQGGVIEDLLGAYQANQSSSVGSLPPLKYRELFYPRIKSAAKNLFNIEFFIGAMLSKTSIQSPFSTEGIRKYMLEHIVKTDKFSELEVELYVVATEVDDFKKVVFGKKKTPVNDAYIEYRNDVSITDACAASMAMPPFYHPHKIQVEGKDIDFFDGELREPLSAHIGEDTGCDLVICSYTHQPLRMRSESGSLCAKGVQAISLQGLYQALENRIRISRGGRRREKALVSDVAHFFDKNDLCSEKKDQLIEIIQHRLKFRENVDYIYIHPRSSDAEMFHLPHFSLNELATEKILRKGFRAGVSALRGLKKPSR